MLRSYCGFHVFVNVIRFVSSNPTCAYPQGSSMLNPTDWTKDEQQ
jgi:hypothetical protein